MGHCTPSGIERKSVGKLKLDTQNRKHYNDHNSPALFEYCEEMEKDIGEELELDVIALCCDFSEDSFDDVAQNYDIDLTDFENHEKFDAVVEYLGNETLVVYSDEDSGMILYQNF